MDPQLTRDALAALRPVYGDVGIIASTVLPSDAGLTVARLVLITDAGPRSVIVTSADHAHHDAWVRARSAAGSHALAVREEPPLLVLEDLP